MIGSEQGVLLESSWNTVKAIAYLTKTQLIPFRYNNNHVSPTEIENLLQTHPAVAESLVFGEKDPTVQELISAVIVLKETKHFKCEVESLH